MFGNKKKEAQIAIGDWVLAKHDQDHRFNSSRNYSECHAGRVVFCDGKELYVVRFRFGLRWLEAKEFRVVGKDAARSVDLLGFDYLSVPELEASIAALTTG